jgi:hypothetical protein
MNNIEAVKEILDNIPIMSSVDGETWLSDVDIETAARQIDALYQKPELRVGDKVKVIELGVEGIIYERSESDLGNMVYGVQLDRVAHPKNFVATKVWHCKAGELERLPFQPDDDLLLSDERIQELAEEVIQDNAMEAFEFAKKLLNTHLNHCKPLIEARERISQADRMINRAEAGMNAFHPPTDPYWQGYWKGLKDWGEALKGESK